MTIVRISQAFALLFIGFALFQNCAVSDSGGALSLGSNGGQGAPTGSATGTGWGTSGSTTGSSTTGGSCTCPATGTVACDQPVMNSCGVQCGTGTQGCTVRCANVDSRCGVSNGQFRHNGGGDGCGGGVACNSEGQVAGDCQDCPCAPCR